jgi:hypothetical protein
MRSSDEGAFDPLAVDRYLADDLSRLQGKAFIVAMNVVHSDAATSFEALSPGWRPLWAW